jgi:5-methylcytosine-specific restriction endonuclease McrA
MKSKTDKGISDQLDRMALAHGTDSVKRTSKEWNKRLKIGTAVKRQPIPRTWKEDAYARQNGKCARCPEPLDFAGCAGDHKIPLAHGGKHNRHNICVMHPACNSSKGSKDAIAESKASGRTLREILK